MIYKNNIKSYKYFAIHSKTAHKTLIACAAAMMFFLAALSFAFVDASLGSNTKSVQQTKSPLTAIVLERKKSLVRLLPRILTTEDALKYNKVFKLQEQGKLQAAASIISEIQNPVLIGHVLGQKYMHPTAYRSKFVELRDWLESYSDHPDAPRIFKLAMKRKPKNTKNPKSPRIDISGKALPLSTNKTVIKKIPKKSLSKKKRIELNSLQRIMRSRLRRGWPTGALETLNDPKHLNLASQVEINDYRSRIAWSYYIYNKDGLAMEHASQSANQSRNYIPAADWTAGIAAWRLGNFKKAHKHFELLAENPSSDRWLVAAGAFWAARTSLKLGEPGNSTNWLRLASKDQYLFYGLLARKVLGSDTHYKWQLENLTNSDLEVATKVPPLKRAIALYESGQLDLAKKEILRIRYRATPEIAKVAIILATALNLPNIQTSMGVRLNSNISGSNYDFAIYPIPNWSPRNKYQIDPALIFALIRQESRFKITAKSKRGARGVMQLMPRTAKFTARKIGLSNISRKKLMTPEINIMLGQAYIKHLMGHEIAGKNLLFTLASYNAGPGNLGKWLPKTNYFEDPLLFLESTRSRETRHFMRVVLTNYWIYQIQMGLEPTTLKQIAAGEWPIYSLALERLESFNDSETY